MNRRDEEEALREQEISCVTTRHFVLNLAEVATDAGPSPNLLYVALFLCFGRSLRSLIR